MKTIIFGQNGAGKTALMTYFGNEAIYNRERNRAMQCAVRDMNANGFNLTVPDYAVCTSYSCTFRMRGYRPRKPIIINPTRLGFQKGSAIKMHFMLPCGTYLVDEGQMYWSSRIQKLPNNVTSMFEESRHWDIDIYIATPAAILIHKDIRRISAGIEVLHHEVRYTRNGCKTIWFVNMIEAGNIDKYLDANARERRKYCKRTKIVANYDVHRLYNAKGCKYKFIEGHLNEDFDLTYNIDNPRTKEEYEQYIQELSNIENEKI